MKLSKEQEKALFSFRYFVSFRNKIAVIMSLVIFIAYYAFVLGVGLFPEVLGYRLGPSSITLGIILGIFLIALCIIATGLYTFLANTYFDKEQEGILRSLEENKIVESLEKGEICYKDCSNAQEVAQ
ncbi:MULTISPECIES: DUF485 domain-containing protein [Helicobacter]|uniref:DUF485 domain-containing protein n=3 Tax=Helicobacter typhlonius TaxID=76936 RepID=A0A099UHI0_9HELI|nr:MULTISPECIES: DUF485 domain-containing protein [Helicobacter]TLD79573.1 DUF485 domain-containing protein [Helicobacter typhlonius]TLD88317.1 DUF485 domain-containing protein [Helicobacter sp. MIT 03-1616]CUU39299.1 FIG00713310: Hypothetical protein [Helicobacter typhlonius]